MYIFLYYVWMENVFFVVIIIIIFDLGNMVYLYVLVMIYFLGWYNGCRILELSIMGLLLFLFIFEFLVILCIIVVVVI